MLRRRFAPLLVSCCLVGLAACDTNDGRDLPPAGPDQTASIVTTTTTPAAETTVAAAAQPAEQALPLAVSAPWGEGQGIPVEYTCEGDDRVPAVSWTGVPAGTVEMAVVLTDLDAEGFVHWIVFGLDPSGAGVPDGVIPEGMPQTINGFGTVGYGGPCPPSGTHTYLLEVYALGQQLELVDGAAAADALTAIRSASIDVASVAGTFTAS